MRKNCLLFCLIAFCLTIPSFGEPVSKNAATWKSLKECLIALGVGNPANSYTSLNMLVSPGEDPENGSRVLDLTSPILMTAKRDGKLGLYVYLADKTFWAPFPAKQDIKEDPLPQNANYRKIKFTVPGLPPLVYRYEGNNSWGETAHFYSQVNWITEAQAADKESYSANATLLSPKEFKQVDYGIFGKGSDPKIVAAFFSAVKSKVTEIPKVFKDEVKRYKNGTSLTRAEAVPLEKVYEATAPNTVFVKPEEYEANGIHVNDRKHYLDMLDACKGVTEPIIQTAIAGARKSLEAIAEFKLPPQKVLAPHKMGERAKETHGQ